MADPRTRSSELKAAAAAAIGSICVGFSPLFVSGLQKAGLDTVSVLFMRYVIALVFLLPLALWQAGALGPEWRRGGRWLYVNGITLGAFQTYCYFHAIETVATSIVVTVFFCYPVVTLLIDRFVFKLPLGWTTVAAVAVVLAGVAATSAPGFAEARLDPVGLAFTVASALGYALYIAVAYPRTRLVAPLAAATFIYASMATMFGLAAFSRGLTLPAEPGLWLNLLFIGTLGGAVQIAAFSYALPRLSSSGYSIIMSLELVTVVLAGVFLLGEQLTGVQQMGIALVIGGVLFERLMRARSSVS